MIKGIDYVRGIAERFRGFASMRIKHDTSLANRVEAIFAAPRGSADWLIRHELQFGGIRRNVPRRNVSPLDGRPPEILARGGMIGGDRFLHHGYAADYERYLQPFLYHAPQTIVEVGILCGTGLAVWCELFPSARVVGLDIDLSHYRDNLDNLRHRGAFARNRPEVFVFDQLQPDVDALDKLFGREGADIVIDDGLHSNAAILNTFQAFKRHLTKQWLYLIEDSTTAAAVISARADGLTIDICGDLTAITQASER